MPRCRAVYQIVKRVPSSIRRVFNSLSYRVVSLFYVGRCFGGATMPFVLELVMSANHSAEMPFLSHMASGFGTYH